MKTIKYLVIIWLIAFAISLKYALFDYRIVSDNANEYALYLQIIKLGHWQFVPDNILCACLSVTLLPALIQKFLNSDPLMTFKLYSCFIIPFLPVIVYLIAKHWCSLFGSFTISLFMMGQYIFVRGATYSRVLISSIFFSVAVLMLIDTRLKAWLRYSIIGLSTICMVLSYYAVSYLSLIIISMAITLIILEHKEVKNRLKPFIIYMLAISTSVGIWHRLILPDSPLSVAFGLLYRALLDVGVSQKSIAPFSVNIIVGVLPRLQITFSWVLLSIAAIGLIWQLLNNGLKINTIALSSLIFLAFALTLPYAETGYGIFRIQYQALIPLSVYLEKGMGVISDRYGWNNKLVLASMISGFMVLTLIEVHLLSQAGRLG